MMPIGYLGRLPSCILLLLLVSGSTSLQAQDTAWASSDLALAGHVLNRIGYGPSPADLGRIQDIGLGAYIEEQLSPTSIDESGNVRLRQKEDALFTEVIPSREVSLIAPGEVWRYRKGTSAPAEEWNQIGFDDGIWLSGPTGIGYGDGDDQTILDDMRQLADDPATPQDEGQSGYLSVYLRRTFRLTAETQAAIDNLILRVDYDDGFRAYLNGVEVARANLPAGDVPHDSAAAGSHEAGTPEEFDLSADKDLLVAGENVLAIQVHNRSLTSSDLSMIPELVGREILPGPTRRVIRGIDELQQLVHIRGVYSQRQLQAVLAEFWENHFTTDYDRLVDYLDDLHDSDATDAMPRGQAESEAAHLEYQEYQFFYENAWGNFGDLLLYSAASPSMLVYLDNVLNVKGKANENYAREILELHTFGVDNRYTQTDVEQLAKCFTGWSICKVRAEDAPTFPDAALAPPVQCGVQFEDRIMVDLGAGWRYAKGTQEPTPGAGGEPTAGWTKPDFDDSGWIDGSTGIGYGDGDDATVLADMRGNYLSVHLRRQFVVDDPLEVENLILEVGYDDGFVAYLNGVEVARSVNMEGLGNPPAYDQNTDGGHEVSEGPEYFNLRGFTNLLRPGENVLAVQVHNTNLNSSDLSLLPRLLDRVILPGSVENGDRNAVWTFHFRDDQHDTDAKVLFEGTPHEMMLPAGRGGQDGLLDALEVVRSLAGHPSTAEFVCIKLIQKFVSDELTLATYKDGTAEPTLVALLDDAIAAWNATEPPGNIAQVMRTILDPADLEGPFWADIAYRSKVKTAIEYINSSLRALDASAGGQRLPQLNDAMGMRLFVRDDPDGYSELGSDWIDTASMLQRIEFAKRLAENRSNDYTWDVAAFVEAWQLRTPQDIVAFFDDVLFQGTLSDDHRNLLLQYLTTDENDLPAPLTPADGADFQQRIQDMVGLMLSLPQWHYQ